ncbi:hypothetical protein FNV43_RR12002 [Rhamnella rubrinervis]|uniref:Uncharacterized protein n=1 Tax=Rhamnella rubrinervis TaxID=2594499 RepID=A0A8K0H6K7_9ROSA|nr:hypothetical protein FNV43_RR12002 [Rhamnella rubrinervis]
MSKMRRTLWTKLKSPFTAAGKSRNDRVHSLSTKLSVNDEYLEVFRTKSYEEMSDRVQRQLGRTNTSRLSSSSSLPFYLDLSEYLLEPRQETLKDMIGNLNFHHLLVDYFGASLQAYNICGLLLKGIHQTRSTYEIIRRVIKSSKRPMHGYTKEDQYRAILGELNAFALLKNPLSIISPVQFRDIHDKCLVLLHRLTSKHKKIKRITKLKKICKKVGGAGLVISLTALLIALLIFAFHSIIGIAAAPALMACSVGLCKKKMETAQGWAKTRSHHEGLGGQLDMAAKGYLYSSMTLIP